MHNKLSKRWCEIRRKRRNILKYSATKYKEVGGDTFYTGEMIVSKRIELAHDALLNNNTYIVIIFTRFIGALRDWINVMPANYKVEVVVREEDISI